MEQFLGFALPGVPYGCTYALVAVCLVLTYQATGVFNFAFGAQAYASAFVFTYLTQFQNWSGFEAFLVSVVVLGPAMGFAFDRLIFRHIPNVNSTAKMVCSLALLVGIPSLLPVIFGPQNLDATATIVPFFNPNAVYFSIARHSDQRDLPGDDLGHGPHVDSAHDPPALHEPGPPDACRRGEPTPRPARRGQRQWRRGHRLDRVELHGEPGRGHLGAGHRRLHLDQLLHVDGCGHCGCGLGAAAIDTDRRGRCHPHRSVDDRSEWLRPPERLHQRQHRASVAIPVPRRRAALSSGHAQPRFQPRSHGDDRPPSTPDRGVHAGTEHGSDHPCGCGGPSLRASVSPC